MGRSVGMFLSTYDSKIDAKNRVSVPAAFRKVLGGEEGVYLWPSLDENKACLEGGSQALVMKLQRSIARLKPMDRRRHALEYGFLGKCKEFSFDAGGGGRIVLTKEFIEAADLKGEVKFVGLGERFELWSADRHQAMEQEMVRLAKESVDLIGRLDDDPYGDEGAGGLS